MNHTKPIQIWIPTELHKQLKITAAMSGRTMTDVVVTAIRRAVEDPRGPGDATSSPAEAA